MRLSTRTLGRAAATTAAVAALTGTGAAAAFAAPCTGDAGRQTQG